MKFSQLVTNALIVIWVCLITTISPSFTVPGLSYGSTSVLEREVSQERSEHPHPVVLTSNKSKSDSLVFIGDVLLARNVEYLIDKHGYDYPYKGIDFSQLSKNPYVIGNFEAVVPRVHKPTEMLMIDFSVNEAFIPAAKEAGFTHFSLANNHSLDFGEQDFQNTKKVLTNNALESFGHQAQFTEDSVTFLSIKDYEIAVIGIQAIEKSFTQYELESVFKYANSRTDFQIVYAHWGTEYSDVSNALQKKMARQFVEAGADLIIGHHPHVVQEVGIINGVPVFYSLGNYIFDQYFSSVVQEGLMLHLDFTDNPIISILPVNSSYPLSQPKYLNESEHQSFLTNLANRSDSSIQRDVSSGIIYMDTLFATSSKIAMING